MTKAESPSPNPESLPLTEYLRHLRERDGLTLRQLEERVGISNAYLSQLETGKIEHPSPSTLLKLAEAFGADYIILMEKAGYINRDRDLKAKAATQRSGRLAATALGSLTQAEEDELLQYLVFIRNRKSKA